MWQSKSHPPVTQVVLAGDNCINIAVRIPGQLKRGANIDVVQVARRPGGGALVTAMALSRWGIPTSYLGVIGSDSNGDELLSWMHLTGVETSGVIRRDNIATREAYAIIDDSERTILDRRDPDNLACGLQAYDLREIQHFQGLVSDACVVLLDKYCAGIHEEIQRVVASCREQNQGPILAYRTGTRASASLHVEGKILPSVDICFTKYQFLQALEFSTDPFEACRAFSNRFGIPIVIEALGPSGAAYYDRNSDEFNIVPAMPIGIPSTTLGAGDFFRAGFLSAFLHRRSIPESVSYGNVAAGMHCGRTEVEDPWSMFFPSSEIALVAEEYEKNPRSGQTHSRIAQPGKIFLSYKTCDKSIVSEVENRLKVNGFDVWMDLREIIPGDVITREIGRGLSQMDVFILFLSQSSSDSGWVELEMSAAVSKMVEGRVRIIPVRLDSCDVPAVLQGIRHIDYQEIGIDGLVSLLTDSIQNHRSGQSNLGA